MADPRLEQIAAEALSRNWRVDWWDTPARMELLVIPAISNAEQQDYLGFGIGVRNGGATLSCWAWEAWSGTLIEPWFSDAEIPRPGDESLFATVTNLEDCCRVFDRGALRYMATMRRCSLTMTGPDASLLEWADLEPLAKQQELNG
jgi:hypothetical protein